MSKAISRDVMRVLEPIASPSSTPVDASCSAWNCASYCMLVLGLAAVVVGSYFVATGHHKWVVAIVTGSVAMVATLFASAWCDKKEMRRSESEAQKKAVQHSAQKEKSEDLASKIEAKVEELHAAGKASTQKRLGFELVFKEPSSGKLFPLRLIQNDPSKVWKVIDSHSEIAQKIPKTALYDFTSRKRCFEEDRAGMEFILNTLLAEGTFPYSLTVSSDPLPPLLQKGEKQLNDPEKEEIIKQISARLEELLKENKARVDEENRYVLTFKEESTGDTFELRIFQSPEFRAWKVEKHRFQKIIDEMIPGIIYSKNGDPNERGICGMEFIFKTLLSGATWKGELDSYSLISSEQVSLTEG